MHVKNKCFQWNNTVHLSQEYRQITIGRLTMKQAPSYCCMLSVSTLSLAFLFYDEFVLCFDDAQPDVKEKWIKHFKHEFRI